MVSQNKLIKEGIRYTDALFEEISKRLEQGVRSSDTLEEFLEKTKEYTKANPLATSEYDKTMLNLILSETNNHRFSRPAQKELVRVTIEEKVGEKIHDVGEDIKDSVRDIVKHGYNNNLPQEKIAENISNRVSSIKNRRARAIARTEIARAAIVSDFVINKERGATGWYVECRNTACPVCKKAWHKKWTPENDDSFTPSDKTAGGKGWVGDKVYSMEDTRSLPPVHPNCYDSETQVFTDNGWKYFKDVTETDKFLSLNPMTNETEFLEPVKLIQVPNVHGKLYHIHNKWFDVCVTPDHDCFIHQRRDGGNRGRYFEPQFRKPSELSSESRFVRCIDTDRENPEHVNVNGLEFAPEDYAFFMAWYISEGSVLHNPETAKSKNYPIKITQEIDANREIIEPVFRNIAEYLGIKLYIGKQYFEFHSKALHDYLVQLGKSHEKYIPKEVFILNKECLNIFLDVYVLGDGHERNHGKYGSIERAVFTSSKRLRDDLSYLILLCGYYPSIALHTKAGTVTTHKNGAYTQKNDVYSIRINNSQYTTFSSCTVDEIDYSDLVYCVELPKYHTLWVMRNGKTSWNGNCRCVVYYIADSKGRVSTKPFTKPATDTPVTGGELPIPTPAQLKKNLRPGEREKYNSYQRNIVLQRAWLKDNPNAPAEDITKHRKRLAFLEKKFNELKRKALGSDTGSVSKPKAKPKTTVKPKPKTTPKPKEKPKAKPKATKPKTESKPTTTQTPTKEQINKNLTKKEQTEYKNLETEVKWANDIINSSTSTDKQKNYAKKRLDTITPRVNELTNKALGLTTKTKTTKKSNKSKKKAKETVEVNKPKNARLTKEECDSLTFEQLAEHHNAKYKGLVKIEKDNNKEYHVFEQTFENGETFKLHVEKSAVNSYKKEGVATANEIIHEVFKVPELFRKETNEIWFRNSQKGLVPNSRGGYKSLGKDEGGSNTHKNKRRWNLLRKMGQADDYNDPDHKIVINPKHFKKLKEFLDILTWRNQPKNITKWKHAIHHEFVHSIDTSRDIWKNDKESLSSRKDFLKIENEEPDFTVYAHTQISESFAEHGGYISYMLANPEEQSKKMEIITYERDEKGRQKSFKPIKEEIDFEEYKKRFPKHYEYFTKLLKEGVKE